MLQSDQGATMLADSAVSLEQYNEVLKRLQLLLESPTVREYVLGESEKSLNQQIQKLQQEIEYLRALKHLEEIPLGQFLIKDLRIRYRGEQNAVAPPVTLEITPSTSLSLSEAIRQVLPSLVGINFTVHDLPDRVIAEGYHSLNRRKDVPDALGHALRPLLEEGIIKRVKESRGNAPSEYRVVEEKLPLSPND